MDTVLVPHRISARVPCTEDSHELRHRQKKSLDPGNWMGSDLPMATLENGKESRGAKNCSKH